MLIRIGKGYQKRTKIVKKSYNPIFRQLIQINVPMDASIEIIILDNKKMIQSKVSSSSSSNSS